MIDIVVYIFYGIGAIALLMCLAQLETGND